MYDCEEPADLLTALKGSCAFARNAENCSERTRTVCYYWSFPPSFHDCFGRNHVYHLKSQSHQANNRSMVQNRTHGRSVIT